MDTWPCGRMVLADKVTWTEVETVMSMQDILEFNELYDAWVDAAQAQTVSP